GHGSHTASTAAGNFISGPFIDGGTGNPFPAPSISGVAPHANLITYDVCASSCPGSAIQGGIDQALLDGIDILNFSISGGVSPWV
ncbi:MAG: S8 family serine peptidase, partial [Desulfuromonadales bacterium]|nr:S8 family serine peptidase [Desulfuromonadales bacterium]